MMRKILGFAAVTLALSGCSNQYFERKDTMTFSAGDAVAWNKAQQIVDPTPRSAYNTNIVTPGESAARAGADYAHGRYKWYNNPNSTDEPKEVMVAPGSVNAGNAPDTPGTSAAAAIGGGGGH